jgi:hypothetical protein
MPWTRTSPRRCFQRLPERCARSAASDRIHPKAFILSARCSRPTLPARSSLPRRRRRRLEFRQSLRHVPRALSRRRLLSYHQSRDARMDNIVSLANAVERQLGCRVKHGTTLAVVELGKAQSLRWSGSVQYFHLVGHSTAKDCYAWTDIDANGAELTAIVLKEPPIHSANDAVRSVLDAWGIRA